MEDAPGETGGPPARPSWREERWSLRLFLALSPRLPRIEQPAPPRRLEPWQAVRVERGRRAGGVPAGDLAATWYPAAGDARGAVLLLPPWLRWGRSYFHRRRRLESLRAAGYHALALDFPGFGASGRPHGFFDREVVHALGHLGRRVPDLPLFLWGVSAGGYWSHPALAHGPLAGTAAEGRVRGAFFEDVAPHLIRWASRTSPWARPFHVLFRLLFPAAWRFLDLRHHAPVLAPPSVAYLSGADDPGVRPADTRDLARRAGAPATVVPAAGHLEAIKRDTRGVIALALRTFDRGARRTGPRPLPPPAADLPEPSTDEASPAPRASAASD